MLRRSQDLSQDKCVLEEAREGAAVTHLFSNLPHGLY